MSILGFFLFIFGNFGLSRFLTIFPWNAGCLVIINRPLGYPWEKKRNFVSVKISRKTHLKSSRYFAPWGVHVTPWYIFDASFRESKNNGRGM